LVQGGNIITRGVKGFFSAWAKIFRSRGAIVIVGFVVGCVFLYVISRNLATDKIITAFQNAIWLPWLPLAVLTYIVGMLLRGLRLQLLVKNEAVISTGTASNIVAVGFAVNNILPARLGEFVRAGMLSERTGMPYLLSLTITFLERLLDGLVILLLLVTASLIVPATPEMRNWTALAALLFIIALLSVAIITLTPQTAVALASAITSRLSWKVHTKVVALVTQINRGFGCLRDAQSAILILVSSFFIWLVESIFFMLVMPCFGLPPGFIRAIITMAVTNLGILIPSTPGHVGTYHYVCKEALIRVCSIPGMTPGTNEPIVVDPNIAISYAVIVHSIYYVTVTVWGVYAMAKYTLELGSTAALAYEAKPIRALPDEHAESMSFITSYPEISARVEEKVTKFWSGLCECFIPEVHRLPDSEEFYTVLREASTFTVTELERLPFRLRVIFDVGVNVFKAIVVLTTGRFLCHLPLEQRRKLIEAWAFGRIPLTRKFMKPIRSLALFYYYDHPSVQALLDKMAIKRGDPTFPEVTQ
jgi:uncharacterized protein (TIRG00374 family)